jgi:putative NIF3 family GTP cyclohydrolase 1 type 2
MIKDILCIENVNVVGELQRSIKKVAICGGDGADFIMNAYNSGCDVYITGDIRYHDACDARDMGIALIDAGHFATENVYMTELLGYIKNELRKRNSSVDVALANKNRNPFIKV